MKQRTLVTILSTAAAVLIAAAVLNGKSGDGNATGQITELNVSPSVATVKGSAQNGSLWLAYTVRWNDGEEQDYPPLKVKGKFTETLSFKLRPEGIREVIVCLWRYKVSSSECAKANGGKPCEYCKRNGFHMEDRVDRQSGS